MKLRRPINTDSCGYGNGFQLYRLWLSHISFTSRAEIIESEDWCYFEENV